VRRILLIPGRIAIFSSESHAPAGYLETTSGYIFDIIMPGLLIVASVFSIQRCAGEVAEWSKALPC